MSIEAAMRQAGFGHHTVEGYALKPLSSDLATSRLKYSLPRLAFVTFCVSHQTFSL
jgi:hypothetical protein